MGAGTIIKVEHPQVQNGLTLDHDWDSANPNTYPALDNLGRVVDLRWQTAQATPAVKDRFTYTYDGASNRTARSVPLQPAHDETYAYDDLNRLQQADRPNDPAVVDWKQEWSLSPTGNWDDFMEEADGLAGWDLNQQRSHNLANELTDITETTGSAWITPTHDSTGNMSSAPWPSGPAQPANAETTRQHYIYDSWNRLRKIYKDNTTTPGTHGDLVATYDYDGINRRIRKTLYDPPAEKPKEKESLTSISITPAAQDINYTLDYYYNTSRQVIEVQKDNNETYPYEQYIWGLRYIHAPILRTEDHNIDATSETLYYCNDANFNTTALVDPSDGAVVERYSYDPYGKVKILDPTTWAEITWAASKQNIILYTGHKFDPESGLYNGDARYLHATIGRWTCPDHWQGYVDGMNLYEYVRSSPIIFLDPTGLVGEECIYSGRYRIDKSTDTHTAYSSVLNSGDGWMWSIVKMIGSGVEISKDTYQCQCEVDCMDYDWGKITYEIVYLRGFAVGVVPIGVGWGRDPDDDWSEWDDEGDSWEVHSSYSDFQNSNDAACSLLATFIMDAVDYGIIGPKTDKTFLEQYATALRRSVQDEGLAKLLAKAVKEKNALYPDFCTSC